MPRVPMPPVSGDDYDIGLTRSEPRADGGRYWPEVFTGQPLGFRPLTASVAVPPPTDRPHPLVLWIHGGGWFTGHRHVTNASLDAMKITETLLGAGYAVAAISYRLSGEARFPAQIRDCKAALRYLRHHAGMFGIDPDRIAAMGESAGGHLALLMGQQTPAAFDDLRIGPSAATNLSAVIAWYPIADFSALGRASRDGGRYDPASADSPAARLLGAPIAAIPATASAASPLSHVSARSAPTLMVHGTADTVVPCAQSELMAAALRDTGVTVDYLPIEGAQHCFFNAETASILPHCIRFLHSWL